MLFHQPDTSFKRLKACWKRALSHGAEGAISAKHPLAAAWSNAMLALDAEISEKRPEDAESLPAWVELASDEGALNLLILDWFAEKVDNFAKDNIIAEDTSLHAMLYQWMRMMPCDPVRLNAR